MREEAARMVGDQAATADEEAGVVVGETCRASQMNGKKRDWEKKLRSPLSKLGVTKLGMAAQLQRRDERASQLEGQRYVARVLARASENKNKGVDRKAQKKRQSAVGVAAKKAQAADRAASSRKKTFDDETRDAVTAESNPDSRTPCVTFCKSLMCLRSLPQARTKSIKERKFRKS
jgi:hypothetical protein